ncbi:MAG TPA: polysaccharide biosynthesis/export family protein [Acidobacteriaceae bacterium]|nr:polysaccharide biosynthesis/export family protein [Acidobacteriaceae bacterium]
MQDMRRCIPVLALALLCAATTTAQKFVPTALPPVKNAPTIGNVLTARATQPSGQESLLIGPGDLLHVSVVREPELGEQVRVRDSGNVNLPLIGNVHVAGLDPGAAADAIAALYLKENYLRHPDVEVFVEQYASEPVSVLGQVRKPGTYMITTPRTLLDLLAMAGGLTPFADRHIMIERAPGAKQREERVFLSNRPHDALMANVMIDPGDRILVPKAGIVYVLGDVRRPGGYVMENESRMTVLQAIAMAAGVDRTADEKKARIIRNFNGAFDAEELPLREIEKGEAPDELLHANDVIYIPFSFARHVVMGTSSIVASASSALIYAGY